MRVVVGRIGKAHGIRGDVTIEVRTDEPERRFFPGATLLVQRDAHPPLVVTDARDHSGRLLLKLEGVDDRNAAEALRGLILEVDVDPNELPEDEDEFYDRQLIGLSARTKDGLDLGTITDVVHLPGQDLLAVHSELFGEVLVPFVQEIVTEVDLLEGVVTMDPPGGLFGEIDELDEGSGA